MSQKSTQAAGPRNIGIPDDARLLGAPWPPLSASFRKIPPALLPCDPPATPEEEALAVEIRDEFLSPGQSAPFMRDVIRTARLLRGARTYAEIGIFDRGNLAYMSRVLADDAVLIGVDVDADRDRDRKLRSLLKPGQRYVFVQGDSRSQAVRDGVVEAMDGRALDCVFIDGGHDAFTVMHDYAVFSELVKPDGLVFFHDSLWEGDADFKGVAQALQEIDRLDPIYLVGGDHPCHRFIPSLWRTPLWGVMGVLPMSQRLVARSV